MYDHIGLRVKDIEVSKRSYRATLEALLLDPDGSNVEVVCLKYPGELGYIPI